MKTTMSMLAILAVLMVSPAFAVSNAILLQCADTKDPAWCLKSFQDEEQRQLKQERIEAEQRYLNQQLGIEQERTRGMALFGAGNAMINGMNQGFNNMRLPVQPMPPLQPMALPFPNAGGR